MPYLLCLFWYAYFIKIRLTEILAIFPVDAIEYKMEE